MFERIFKSSMSSNEGKKDTTIDDKKRKENAKAYENAKILIESKKWDEYLYSLEKERDFLKRSIPISEDAKKYQDGEVYEFNSKLFKEIEEIKNIIFALAEINNSSAKSLIIKLEKIRERMSDFIIKNKDEKERDVVKNKEPELEEIEIVEEHFSEEKINEFIRDIQEQADWYRKNYLGEVLIPMKNKYFFEKDQRLKELLGDEFERTKEQMVVEIDMYDASVPKIEDLGISTALAELHEARSAIASLDKDSVERVNEIRAA